MASTLDNPKTSLLKAEGIVVKSDERFIWVQVANKSGCNGCSQGGCGNQALAKMLQPRQTPIRLPIQDCEFVEGESVILVMNESRLVQHSAVMYGLPLLLMFVFALFAQWLMPNSHELTRIFVAGIGLWAGWFLARKFYKPTLPRVEKYSTEPYQEI